MVERKLGERNFGFDSLKSRVNRDMEEKGIVAVCGGAVSSLRGWVISPTLHCYDLSVVCGAARGVQPEEPHTTRSELTAVY